MTDQERKAMELALEAFENIRSEKDIKSAHIIAKNARYSLREALRQALAQDEQEPVAWVESLEKPQPRCVTNLKYRSVAEVDAGVQFIPLYAASLNLKQDTNKVCEKLCAQARRTERGACHQIVWDYGFSRIDNEEVQAACVDLARAIQARGQNE